MKNNIHIFLLQAYGDNTVTLSILQQFSQNESIIIHGTSLTKQILDLLHFHYHFLLAFNTIPSFYNIRKDGIYNACKTIFELAKYIKKNIPKNSKLFFEKNDFRLQIIKLLCPNYQYFFPKKNKNNYLDRGNALASLFNLSPLIFSVPCNPNNIDKLLINPTGSRSVRNLHTSTLDAILSVATEKNLTVSLIDYQKCYESYATKVNAYHTDTTLDNAVELLKSADAYCGPDSLFIHLAYLYQKPFFCFMNYDSSYFLPPYSKNNSFVVNSGKEDIMKNQFRNWIENK